MCELSAKGIFAILADASLRAFDFDPWRRQVEVGSLNRSPPILSPAASKPQSRDVKRTSVRRTLALWNDPPEPSKRKDGTLTASLAGRGISAGTSPQR